MMKTYGITLFVDGEQARVIVGAKNKPAAIMALVDAGFNTTVPEFNNYGAESANALEKILAEGNPGTVMWRPLDSDVGDYKPVGD